ncbi:MAG: hypothetical protein AAGF57_19730 [Pseudomonadota bacterium]
MKIVRDWTIGAIAFLVSATAAGEVVVINQAISEQEVRAAQDSWCNALLDISKTYADDGHTAAKALTEKIIDNAYAYQSGVVLFKPTLATNPQTFRTTRAGAVSYFVGGDPSFPDDDGFAIKDWKNCEVQNAAMFIFGDSATSMGKVHFTDGDNNTTSVDKTWVFIKDDLETLRIAAHHSSLEYQPE